MTEITALAHAAGAFTCVDGVSYAPHGFPNVGALGPDIYLFSAYKTYGPHQGLMVIRRTLAELLPNQGHFFNAGSLYKRFTPAGPDHAQVAACVGMADYVDAVHDLMRARESAALAQVMDALKERNDLRVIGPTAAHLRAPTVALDLGRDAVAVAARLADHGIMAAGGDFYAVRALEAMGVDAGHGVLRLSFTHYTDDSEIDQLLRALDAVL